MIETAYEVLIFFFKQKTAYEMRISDWSSDVCSSDLHEAAVDELRARGVDCSFVFYDDPIYGELLRGVVAREQLPATWCANREVSLRHYRQLKPDWIIFGNHYASLDELPTTTRSALLYHGIGIKSCYYDRELAAMGLRFEIGRAHV